MIELNGLNVSERQRSIIMDKMDKMGHEQVVFCRDEKTGLKAIIAIHDTTMDYNTIHYRSENVGLQK